MADKLALDFVEMLLGGMKYVLDEQKVVHGLS